MDLRRLLILSVVMGLLMAGCRHEHEYDSRLIQAEGLVESYPDSALRLLETVDTTMFAEPDMALYALVKTGAQSQINTTLVNDSLIRRAIDYFSTHEEPRRTSRAYCIQGKVMYYRTYNDRQLITESMLSYYKAKDIAERNNLDLEAGRALAGMVDVAGDRFLNYAEAYKYSRKELEYFRRCGDAKGIQHALCNKTLALIKLGKLDEAERSCEELMDYAKSAEDDEYRIKGLRTKAFLESERNNDSTAYEIYSEICRSKWATINDTVTMGATLIWSGHTEEGAAILRSVEKKRYPTWRDGIMASYCAERGDFREAYGLMRSMYNAESIMLAQTLNNNTISQLESHYELTQQLDRAEVERARWRLWFVIVVAAVVVAGVIAFFVWRYRRQQRAIDDKIRIAEDLQQALDRSQYDRERIQADYDTTRTEADRSATMVRTLLHGRYEMLETLTELVTRNSVVKGGRTRLADAVTRLIEDYSGNTERYAELERQADALFDNLISDFRRTFQGLKDADYRLYLFSVMGLSNQTIAVFLKEDRLTAVYDRRRRLKDRIKQAEPAIRDRFLPYL